jgi:tetratricopeptide (TPR) repeat protein
LVRRLCRDGGVAGADLAPPQLLSLLAVAPDLAAHFDVPADIRAAVAFSREGNLPAWTLRIAHGVTDFLLAAYARTPGENQVTFLNVAEADPTDREFIAVLQRRADPAVLTVDVAEQPDADPPGDCRTAAKAYLAINGAHADDDDVSTLLRGSDLCMRMAYYDAALEWASHGRAMLDPATRADDYGKLTRNMLFALLLLGRITEAEAICTDAQLREPDPALLAHVTYVLAILNVRLYDPARHDYDAARSWIERSLDFTDRLPPSETRAVNRAFLMNTMALVEMRKGNHAAAFDLLAAGLRTMEEHAPGKYSIECGLLLHNRARLHSATKQPDRAIDDLTRLLQFEPGNSEAYFDRGLLHLRAGRPAEALVDYDRAIQWSPPYWEPHFNRAQTLVALGRAEEALADYDRVSVLQPDHLETLLNRGHLHFERHDLDLAARDATHALRLDPGNARALCLRGLLALQRQDTDAAYEDFSASIAADPLLADAWANRATIHYKKDRLNDAAADIERAAALRPDPDILYNRDWILAKRLRAARENVEVTGGVPGRAADE